MNNTAQLDPDVLLNWDIPEVAQVITPQDCILYALGIGFGSDPCDRQQLKFVYEAYLESVPTMAVILCYPGQWHAAPGTGIVSSHVVQGSQSFVIHEGGLPTACTVRGKTRVTGVYDKGPGRGALVTTECCVTEVETGRPVCTIGSTHFCRANGGFGGTSGPSTSLVGVPVSPPDHTCELKTLPQAGLIYRLSGDRNPLHVDPEFAQRAGFKAPILHGRCTFGVVGHAILRSICHYAASKLRSMSARFVSPVYPGETITTEMWRKGNRVLFRALIRNRDQIILDRGLADVSE